MAAQLLREVPLPGREGLLSGLGRAAGIPAGPTEAGSPVDLTPAHTAVASEFLQGPTVTLLIRTERAVAVDPRASYAASTQPRHDARSREHASIPPVEPAIRWVPSLYG